VSIKLEIIVVEMMMNISVGIEIDSPKSNVWAVITDISNCANMISGIIDLEIIHKPEEGLIGLKWTETRKMFGKEATETMWITDYKDEEYYCTRAENCGAIYTTKMSVSEIQGRTLLTMSFSGTADSIFIKMMTAMMNFFMKKTMVKILEKDLSEIKEFVERGLTRK
jgi:hypothetical protein